MKHIAIVLIAIFAWVAPAHAQMPTGEIVGDTECFDDDQVRQIELTYESYVRTQQLNRLLQEDLQLADEEINILRESLRVVEAAYAQQQATIEQLEAISGQLEEFGERQIEIRRAERRAKRLRIAGVVIAAASSGALVYLVTQ